MECWWDLHTVKVTRYPDQKSLSPNQVEGLKCG